MQRLAEEPYSVTANNQGHDFVMRQELAEIDIFKFWDFFF